ncbi:histone-lysine N-methyltransferase 2D [Drosophila erecta]|uniref:histone-lysine N-methyltransferase 2D n=1 Tax=Drosophila erecta TaxID=7220 RepID=UPI000F04AC9F|nr:histone-lysine N-methyltransferase 2D [Drosophila erecta]
MPSRKRLDNKVRRRRNPVQLNDFLRGDDEPVQIITPLSNESHAQVSTSTQNANTSSIGTIPSNGLVESDVTPVMSPTPQPGTCHTNVNAWPSPGEISQPDGTYNVSIEEYPDLGKRSKRAKQPAPKMPNLENGSPGLRLRNRRSRIIDPPVLANFLPDSGLPTKSNSKQQSVANWLSLVRPSDSQKTVNDQASGSLNKITLLRRDSVQQPKQKSPDEKYIQQQQQNTPAKAQQQTSAANAAKDQQNTTDNSPKPQQKSSDHSLQQQMDSVNSSQQPMGSVNSSQQQMSSVHTSQQQKRSPVRALSQEQNKSSGDHNQQHQEKNPGSSYQQNQKTGSPGKQQQQQQKGSANTGRSQKKRKSPSIQQSWQNQMGPASSSQQEQLKSSGTVIKQQQQPKSLEKTLEQQQKSPRNSGQQEQLQMSPINQSQPQSKRPHMPIHSHTRSPEKKAPMTNTSSVPIGELNDERSQQPTQCSCPSNVNNEDEDVVPPTPNRESGSLSKRFPRRNHKQRMVRSLQAVSREFTQSSPEGSPKGTPEGSLKGSPKGSLKGSPEGSPEQEVVPCQQQKQSHQVKSLPENQPISRMQQLAMRSALNSNAQEFRPSRQAGGSNQRAQVSRLSRRRRRQRYMRSLHVQSLLPSRELGPSQSLRPVCHVPGCCYYSAPPPAVEYTSEIAEPPSPPPLPVTIPVQAMIPPPTIKVNTVGNPPPMVFYNPLSGNIWSNPSPYIPIEIQNNMASQSVFRLASLPCTGVGTPTMDSFTSWPPPNQHLSHSPLPSSISWPSQLSNTLSSPPPLEAQQQEQLSRSIHQDEDLLYSRPLLDMDQEETQPEKQDQDWQWESDLQTSRFQSQPQVIADVHGEPNAAVARDVGPSVEPHKIFRAPSQHGQDYPKPDLNCVPSSIKKLHHLISSKYSDYSFVYAMSAQLSQDCVPMDCYVYLKMVLLASIVSIESDEVRAPISLCIIATDSLMANRLMSKVGQLAPRFLGPHDYGLQPTFSALPTRFSWVVASPLLLAQQGVYYAGDWTRLPKDQGCQLEKCIENGAVPVPQLHIDQPLEAAVWTHWQPDNSSNQTLSLAKLCPIFGLPIYMGAQVSKSLWNLIIQQHSAEGQNAGNDGLNIPEDDMRMLIHLLHQRKTTFTDGAQHMLQKYYVISRKERPTVFSSKTYVVLKQFSECFAKLALRLEVLESDVCVAIFHCEHFVQSIFGAKEHLAPPAVVTFNVISRIDPYMNEFARWLLQYLDSYEDEELGMHAAKRRRTDSWDMP